jgi:membrane protein
MSKSSAWSPTIRFSRAFSFSNCFSRRCCWATGLGYALGANPDLQQRVGHSVVVEFPVIGPQLQHNIHSLRGNGLVLVIGIAGTIWAGTRVSLAAGNAMNHLWDDRSRIGRTRLSPSAGR